jgi:hypothetical protein
VEIKNIIQKEKTGSILEQKKKEETGSYRQGTDGCGEKKQMKVRVGLN